MEKFKCNIINVLRTLISYILAVLVIVLIIYNLMIFWKGIQLSYPVLGGIGGALLLVALAIMWNDCICIVIQEGELIIYRGKKVKNRFMIADCKMNSKITTKGLHSDCQLIIEAKEGVEYLDCSMMGIRRFKKLLEAIGFNNPIKVNAQ